MSSIEDAKVLLPQPVPQPVSGRDGCVWKVGKFTFRADFDSANLFEVKDTSNSNEFELWTRRDCHGTEYETTHRTWFYYGVHGHTKGDFVIMTLMNLNKQAKLYANDFRPFYWTAANKEWQPTGTRVTYEKVGEEFKVRFTHKFESVEETFFAFCIPFSYDHCQAMLDNIDQMMVGADIDKGDDTSIYYKRQTLAHSLGGRNVDLITITDWHGVGEEEEGGLPHTFPHAAREGCASDFPEKKVFFISARVHPGETPASHMFNGMLAFLLRQGDRRVEALRRLYVFKLVPLVNPDGVAEGHYRQDTLGQNLNRFYVDPDPAQHPSVAAIKAYISRAAARGLLEFYLDLHAHANKRGVFAYGNALQGTDHIETLTYCRLAALNSPVWDFFGCNFTERNMGRADKDGFSKEGAGRVALFRETGLPHLYTIEANYNMARSHNKVPPCQGDASGRSTPPPQRNVPSRFGAHSWQQVGRSLLVAALDLHAANPWSRVAGSEFGSVEGVRCWVLQCLKSNLEKRDTTLPAVSDASRSSVKDISSRVFTSRRRLSRESSNSSSSSSNLPAAPSSTGSSRSSSDNGRAHSTPRASFDTQQSPGDGPGGSGNCRGARTPAGSAYSSLPAGGPVSSAARSQQRQGSNRTGGKERSLPSSAESSLGGSSSRYSPKDAQGGLDLSMQYMKSPTRKPEAAKLQVWSFDSQKPGTSSASSSSSSSSRQSQPRTSESMLQRRQSNLLSTLQQELGLGGERAGTGEPQPSRMDVTTPPDQVPFPQPQPSPRNDPLVDALLSITETSPEGEGSSNLCMIHRGRSNSEGQVGAQKRSVSTGVLRMKLRKSLTVGATGLRGGKNPATSSSSSLELQAQLGRTMSRGEMMESGRERTSLEEGAYMEGGMGTGIRDVKEGVLSSNATIPKPHFLLQMSGGVEAMKSGDSLQIKALSCHRSLSQL